jgi:hypothetical protein
VNRWLSIRFNLLSSVVVGAAGVVCLVTPSISASTAGFTLAFASMFTRDVLSLVRFDCRLVSKLTYFQVLKLVGLEKSMVCHFSRCILGGSYSFLGSLRTCQGIHRTQT